MECRQLNLRCNSALVLNSSFYRSLMLSFNKKHEPLHCWAELFYFEFRLKFDQKSRDYFTQVNMEGFSWQEFREHAHNEMNTSRMEVKGKKKEITLQLLPLQNQPKASSLGKIISTREAINPFSGGNWMEIYYLLDNNSCHWTNVEVASLGKSGMHEKEKLSLQLNRNKFCC